MTPHVDGSGTRVWDGQALLASFGTQEEARRYASSHDLAARAQELVLAVADGDAEKIRAAVREVVNAVARGGFAPRAEAFAAADAIASDDVGLEKPGTGKKKR